MLLLFLRYFDQRKGLFNILLEERARAVEFILPLDPETVPPRQQRRSVSPVFHQVRQRRGRPRVSAPLENVE